jgi:hypothetical protein
MATSPIVIGRNPNQIGDSLVQALSKLASNDLTLQASIEDLRKSLGELTEPLVVPGYETSSLPDPAQHAGACVRVTNPINFLVFSDGTNWRTQTGETATAFSSTLISNGVVSGPYVPDPSSGLTNYVFLL